MFKKVLAIICIYFTFFNIFCAQDAPPENNIQNNELLTNITTKILSYMGHPSLFKILCNTKMILGFPLGYISFKTVFSGQYDNFFDFKRISGILINPVIFKYYSLINLFLYCGEKMNEDRSLTQNLFYKKSKRYLLYFNFYLIVYFSLCIGITVNNSALISNYLWSFFNGNNKVNDADLLSVIAYQLILSPTNIVNYVDLFKSDEVNISTAQNINVKSLLELNNNSGGFFLLLSILSISNAWLSNTISTNVANNNLWATIMNSSIRISDWHEIFNKGNDKYLEKYGGSINNSLFQNMWTDFWCNYFIVRHLISGLLFGYYLQKLIEDDIAKYIDEKRKGQAIVFQNNIQTKSLFRNILLPTNYGLMISFQNILKYIYLHKSIPKEAMIFVGQSGTGKTSLIHSMAYYLYLYSNVIKNMTVFNGRVPHLIQFPSEGNMTSIISQSISQSILVSDIIIMEEIEELVKNRNDSLSIDQFVLISSFLTYFNSGQATMGSYNKILFASCLSPEDLDPAAVRRFNIIINTNVVNKRKFVRVIVNKLFLKYLCGSDSKCFAKRNIAISVNYIVEKLINIRSGECYNIIENIFEKAVYSAYLINNNPLNIIDEKFLEKCVLSVVEGYLFN